MKSEDLQGSNGGDFASLPRVGIVIVHYACFDDTIRCLSSLAELNYPNFFSVIVDSCSPDGSGKQLRALADQYQATVILSPENAGFAAGSNIGIGYARKYDAEYVWLLNPDTEVDKDALLSLVKEAEERRDVAAFGSKILYGDSSDKQEKLPGGIIWGAGGEIDFASQLLRMPGAGRDLGQFNQGRECDYLPGCSILFRCSVLDRVGFLPEEYFMYLEETDWCTELRKSGEILRYVPESIVWHHFDDRKTQQAFGVYYYNRNQRRFWYRYGTFFQRGRLVLRTLCRDLPSAINALLRASDPMQEKVFKAHVASCVDFLRARKGRNDLLVR